MYKYEKIGRRILLLAMMVFIATGCMPTVSNPGWTSLTVGDDAVFVALATGQVVALNAKNGDTVWSYPLQQQQSGPGCGLPRLGGEDSGASKPLDAVYGSPALTDKLVLIGSFDHHLYAFDRATGRNEWTFPTQEAILGGATIYEGVAYFGSTDRSVYAVDVATHELVWPKPFLADKRPVGTSLWGAPAVDEKRVYIGSMDHFVYAINRKTGAEEWHKDLGGSIPGAVVLSNGVLFVGGVNKRLHALNAEDGAELWTQSLDHWVMGEALVYDGYVYVGTLGGRVYAFKASDGSPLWDKPVSLKGAIRAAPARLGDDLIVATDADLLYRVNAKTGEYSEFFKSLGSVLSTPIVMNNVVYVGTTTGNVHAIDGKGQQLWVYPPVKK